MYLKQVMTFNLLFLSAASRTSRKRGQCSRTKATTWKESALWGNYPGRDKFYFVLHRFVLVSFVLFFLSCFTDCEDSMNTCPMYSL